MSPWVVIVPRGIIRRVRLIMSLVINTNTSSMNAQRQILRSGDELDKATTRLSSGKRLNSAADDAAGLAISSRMTSQVRGLDQAVRNANDGVSMIQTAEGALNETSNMLQRIRELAIQASNGIFTDGDRVTLNAEVQQLVQQIDFVSTNTKFNGVAILDGTQGKVDLQVGAQANQTVSIEIPGMSTKSLGLSSVSGDLVGDQMAISGDGTLTYGIEAASLSINGVSIEGVKAGSTVQKLLDNINSSYIGVGVKASTITKVSADAVGNGILQGANTLNITGVSLSGGQQTFIIENTSSLNELVDKVNAKTGGVITASLDEKGRLNLTTTAFATVTVVDSTAGAATGISPGSNSDPDISNIVQALNTYWVSEAETRISTYFGIQGHGENLTLNLQYSGSGSDGAGGAIASVTPNPSDLKLNIDMADFSGVTLPNGPDSGGQVYGDRVIAHELVHAVMAVNMNLGTLPGWFTEGTAELIHGADSRVVGDIASINTSGGFGAALKTTPGSPGSSAGYSTAYIAAKKLHEIIIAHGGTTGIKEVFDQLKTGVSLDNALIAVKAAHGGITEFSNLATYESWISANGHTKAIAINAAGALGDTGSIAGSDYGNPALNATDVLSNTANQGAIHFNLVIPAQYGGGSKTADAQLVLKSVDGSSISIANGASGTDSILSNLGFAQVGNSNVTGVSISNTNQALGIVVNDVKINGTDIGAVEGALGLKGKVDAINAKTDITGVTASTLANEAFKTDSTLTTSQVVGTSNSYINAAGSILLNGVSIAFSLGDGTLQQVDNINAVTSKTGVTASVNEYGTMTLFSDNSFTLKDDGTTSFVTDNGMAGAGKLGTATAAGASEQVKQKVGNTTGVAANGTNAGAYTFTLNGVTVNVNNNSNVAATVASINGVVGHGVTASVGAGGTVNAGKLILTSSAGGIIGIGGTDGAAFIADSGLGAAVTLAPNSYTVTEAVQSTGNLDINGTVISFTNLQNADTTISEINSKTANTGVSAKIDENGKLQFSSASTMTLKASGLNSFETARALGITFNSDTIGGSDGVNDTLIIYPRLNLKSRNDAAISVEVTSSGEAATGLKDLNIGLNSLQGSSLSSLNISTQLSAEKSISVVDNALTTINATRSNLGAINNRLDFTIANLSNISEKTTAALSRIVDTDFAQETAKLSRATVLQQAAQAMLAQANQRPQQVLSLLR